MFGFGGMTTEIYQRMAERMVERDRRVANLMHAYPQMSTEEAYIRVSCEMEHEQWQAAQERKLDEIRKNGT